jgi:hypothetical protein
MNAVVCTAGVGETVVVAVSVAVAVAVAVLDFISSRSRDLGILEDYLQSICDSLGDCGCDDCADARRCIDD